MTIEMIGENAFIENDIDVLFEKFSSSNFYHCLQFAGFVLYLYFFAFGFVIYQQIRFYLVDKSCSGWKKIYSLQFT